MSRGPHARKHEPQFLTLVEGGELEALKWWRQLTPVDRGRVITACCKGSQGGVKRERKISDGLREWFKNKFEEDEHE